MEFLSRFFFRVGLFGDPEIRNHRKSSGNKTRTKHLNISRKERLVLFGCNDGRKIWRVVDSDHSNDFRSI